MYLAFAVAWFIFFESLEKSYIVIIFILVVYPVLVHVKVHILSTLTVYGEYYIITNILFNSKLCLGVIQYQNIEDGFLVKLDLDSPFHVVLTGVIYATPIALKFYELIGCTYFCSKISCQSVVKKIMLMRSNYWQPPIL